MSAVNWCGRAMLTGLADAFRGTVEQRESWAQTMRGSGGLGSSSAFDNALA